MGELTESKREKEGRGQEGFLERSEGEEKGREGKEGQEREREGESEGGRKYYEHQYGKNVKFCMNFSSLS